MRKLILFVLILFSLFAKVAISEIVRELDQKTDVSRLEYSLDKLMPKLVSAMQDRTGSLERHSQNKIDEVCRYSALPEEEILDIQCNLTSHMGKFYFSEYPDKEFEQEMSELADSTAEHLLEVFGNFGDPLSLNIFEKQNILHLATGRLFTKELYFYDEKLDEERLRIGRALSEIMNLFVRVDLGKIELTYRYGINDPYERMKNRTLKFPNRKLWSKIIGTDIIISQGEPVENSE